MTSSMPPGGGDVPGPAADGSQRPGGKRALLLPGAIGVVIGLVVGVLAGNFFSRGAGEPGVDTDLGLACGYASSLTEDFDPDAAIDIEGPMNWQAMTVSGHAQAAAAADDAYAELRTHGVALLDGVRSRDAALIEDTLEAIAQTCQGL